MPKKLKKPMKIFRCFHVFILNWAILSSSFSFQTHAEGIPRAPAAPQLSTMGNVGQVLGSVAQALPGIFQAQNQFNRQACPVLQTIPSDIFPSSPGLPSGCTKFPAIPATISGVCRDRKFGFGSDAELPPGLVAQSQQEAVAFARCLESTSLQYQRMGRMDAAENAPTIGSKCVDLHGRAAAKKIDAMMEQIDLAANALLAVQEQLLNQMNEPGGPLHELKKINDILKGDPKNQYLANLRNLFNAPGNACQAALPKSVRDSESMGLEAIFNAAKAPQGLAEASTHVAFEKEVQKLKTAILATPKEKLFNQDVLQNLIGDNASGISQNRVLQEVGRFNSTLQAELGRLAQNAGEAGLGVDTALTEDTLANLKSIDTKQVIGKELLACAQNQMPLSRLKSGTRKVLGTGNGEGNDDLAFYMTMIEQAYERFESPVQLAKQLRLIDSQYNPDGRFLYDAGITLDRTIASQGTTGRISDYFSYIVGPQVCEKIVQEKNNQIVANSGRSQKQKADAFLKGQKSLVTQLENYKKDLLAQIDRRVLNCPSAVDVSTNACQSATLYQTTSPGYCVANAKLCADTVTACHGMLKKEYEKFNGPNVKAVHVNQFNTIYMQHYAGLQNQLTGIQGFLNREGEALSALMGNHGDAGFQLPGGVGDLKLDPAKKVEVPGLGLGNDLKLFDGQAVIAFLNGGAPNLKTFMSAQDRLQKLKVALQEQKAKMLDLVNREIAEMSQTAQENARIMSEMASGCQKVADKASEFIEKYNARGANERTNQQRAASELCEGLSHFNLDNCEGEIASLTEKSLQAAEFVDQGSARQTISEYARLCAERNADLGGDSAGFADIACAGSSAPSFVTTDLNRRANTIAQIVSYQFGAEITAAQIKGATDEKAPGSIDLDDWKTFLETHPEGQYLYASFNAKVMTHEKLCGTDLENIKAGKTEIEACVEMAKAAGGSSSTTGTTTTTTPINDSVYNSCIASKEAELKKNAGGNRVYLTIIGEGEQRDYYAHANSMGHTNAASCTAQGGFERGTSMFNAINNGFLNGFDPSRNPAFVQPNF